MTRAMTQFFVAALAMAVLTTGARAATVIVDKGGTGQFTTIQDAINDPGTTAGDTVKVVDTTGTGYVETVEVTKNGLTLFAAPGVSIQQAPASPFSFNGTRTGAIGIAPSVNTVHIEGFNVVGGTGSGSYGVWVESDTSKITVRGNSFDGDFAAAVGTNSGGVGTLTGLTITENTVTDFGMYGFDIATGAADFEITKNSIFDGTNNGGFVTANIRIDDAATSGIINFNNLFGRDMSDPGVSDAAFGLFLDGFLADGAAGVVDARFNWWNHIDGPRPVGFGASLFASNPALDASALFFGGPVSGTVLLDPFANGPITIPEPASLALLGLGGLVLLRRRRA